MRRDVCVLRGTVTDWETDKFREAQTTGGGRGDSHPSQEFHISSAGASRTRALTAGSPALYQLSYGTGIGGDSLSHPLFCSLLTMAQPPPSRPIRYSSGPSDTVPPQDHGGAAPCRLGATAGPALYSPTEREALRGAGAAAAARQHSAGPRGEPAVSAVGFQSAVAGGRGRRWSVHQLSFCESRWCSGSWIGEHRFKTIILN